MGRVDVGRKTPNISSGKDKPMYLFMDQNVTIDQQQTEALLNELYAEGVRAGNQGVSGKSVQGVRMAMVNSRRTQAIWAVLAQRSGNSQQEVGVAEQSSPERSMRIAEFLKGDQNIQESVPRQDAFIHKLIEGHGYTD